jgi:hypothetical protein
MDQRLQYSDQMHLDQVLPRARLDPVSTSPLFDDAIIDRCEKRQQGRQHGRSRQIHHHCEG